MQVFTNELYDQVNAVRRCIRDSSFATVSEEGKAVGLFTRNQPQRPTDPINTPEHARQVLFTHHPWLAKITNWDNIVLAGGSVARSISKHGYRYSFKPVDADMYFYGIRDEVHLREVAERLCKDIGPAWMLRTNAIISMGIERTDEERNLRQQMIARHINHFSCQVIMLKADTIEDIMSTFDVDECCVAFNGSSILIHPRAVGAFSSCESLLRPELASKTMFSRLLKYASFTRHRIVIPFEETVAKVREIRESPHFGQTNVLLRFMGTSLCLFRHSPHCEYLITTSDSKETNRSDSIDWDEYGASYLPSRVMMKASNNSLHVCNAVMTVLAPPVNSGFEVALSWNKDTSVGSKIDDLVHSPTYKSPDYILHRLEKYRDSYTDDMLLAIIRRDDDKFRASLETTRVRLMALKDGFWSVPALRLGTRQELFGRVGCDASEMLS